MKRLTILSLPLVPLVFSYSNLVLAGIFPEDSQGDGIWGIKGTGGYYSQSNNLAIANAIIPLLDLGDGINGAVPLFIDTQPEQAWSWGVELNYIFPSHRYDIQANYNRLFSDKTEQLTNIADASFPITRKSDLSFDYNQIDATFGNYFKINPRFAVRMGYGVEYVSIQNKSTDYFNVPALESMFPAEKENSKNNFWGIGPKFTLDNMFTINPALSFVGRAGLSILFGQAKNSVSVAVDPVGNNSNPFVSGELKQTRAAFGFDGELGLRWHQALDDDMDWNIEVGYQGTTYLNALQDAPVIIFDPAQFATNFGPQENYFNYGPYITLGVDFF